MNNRFYILILGVFLSLFIVSSCNLSEGGAKKLEFNKEVCLSDLKSILQGKDSKSICSPIAFKLEKKQNKYSIKGKQTHGHFDIRTSRDSIPIFLQAPHSWSDSGTGEILRKLTKSIKPKISFKNSVHRNHNDKNDSRTNFDLGKRRESVLVILSKAFFEENPRGSIIQIHGFESTKRKTIKGKHADVIVSSGSYQPSAQAQKLTKCLKSSGGGLQILLFPREVTELGGTKNVLSKIRLKNGHSSFIHLEMSKRYRDLVTRNKKVLNSLSSCIKELGHVK